MRLILFDGLPGTGKSTLAEAAGRKLCAPVFSRDRIAGVLVKSGLLRDDANPNDAAHDVMALLAERQFHLGQSAIFDGVVGTEARQARWRRLAADSGAALQVVQCVCSDGALHRARIEGRQRGIPGWHELTWAHVETVATHYQPWPGDCLIVDAVDRLEDNVRRVLSYLSASG